MNDQTKPQAGAVADAQPSVAAIKPRPKSVTLDMADRFGMEATAFERTLRGTVFPADAPQEEFAAFLLVCKEYELNPLTKEIYAFPKRGGGIVPMVSIDGWLKLINKQKNFDGMEFEDIDDGSGNFAAVKCTIYRKDRSRPTAITEYLSECVRSTDPWKMKHRMLRHKAMIQCARYAFGFAGIHDEDEAQRIAEARDVTPVNDKTLAKALAVKLAANTSQGEKGFDPAFVDAETGEIIDAAKSTPANAGKVIEAKAEPLAPVIDVEALISEARSVSMEGRREFDAWCLARTPDERAALAPEMKVLMAASRAVDHPKEAQPAPEPEPEAQVEAEPQPEVTGPAFNFDVELDAFEKQIAAIHTSSELNDFGLKVSHDAKGWFMAAPEAMQADARQFFLDRLGEVTKAEDAAKRKAASEAKAAEQAAAKAAEAPTADPSPLDELRKAGSAAAVQGVRRYKLFRGKLNQQHFEALNGSALDAELMELARKSDEDV